MDLQELTHTEEDGKYLVIQGNGNGGLHLICAEGNNREADTAYHYYLDEKDCKLLKLFIETRLTNQSC